MRYAGAFFEMIDADASGGIGQLDLAHSFALPPLRSRTRGRARTHAQTHTRANPGTHARARTHE